MKLVIAIFLTLLIGNKDLKVVSAAFSNNGFIPAKYTCQGTNISPALVIGEIPAEAKTLALIMDDPDASNGTFDHWVMWNIPLTNKIEENTAPGIQGNNSKGERGYTGPCPPSGTHHYHFKIYALDATLDLPEGSDKKELEKAMKGHIVAKGELTGLYKK